MIDSALFSKSVVLELGEQINVDFVDSETMINKSTLYHLILSFVNLINQDQSTLRIQKNQIVSEFGFNIGKNISEEQSLGHMKYFIVKNQKDKGKPFLGEFKFLNVKVWPTVFGSSSKLFAIVGQTGGGYKLEDKEFGLTKWLSGQEEKVRFLRRLLFQLSKGVLEGFLNRFDLSGDVSYNEVSDNHVNFELKNLTKKTKIAFK